MIVQRMLAPPANTNHRNSNYNHLAHLNVSIVFYSRTQFLICCRCSCSRSSSMLKLELILKDTQHKVVFKFTVIYSYMPRTHSFSDSLLSALMHAIQASNVRSQSSLLHTKLTAFRSSTNIDMYSGNCSGSVQNE